MKKTILLCILIIGVFFLTGCSFSKEDVKLLTKKEATNYAKENFGKATFKEIKSETEEEVVYVFLDSKYKFEYEITSYIDQLCLDPTSCADVYSQRTDSNFAKQYYNYIISSSQNEVSVIEKKYNVSIKNDDGYHSVKQDYYLDDCATQAAFYSVYGDNTNEKTNAANELADYVKKVDNRKFFSKCSIWIRGNEKNSNDVYPRIDSVLLEQ